MRFSRLAALAAASALAVSGCSSMVSNTSPTEPSKAKSPAPQPTTGAQVGAGQPCAGTKPPASWAHAVWILMENRGLDEVNGSLEAPYLNSLAGQCGLATGYSGVAHPSLPNYIALTSGSTQSVADDVGGPLDVPSLFGLLGRNWKSLEESIPAHCDHSDASAYAVRHDPASYYTPSRPNVIRRMSR
ncbi:MAG: hypothetical protein JO337_05860 [Acidimicrobiales bacterium]|nr:hypothetical protein [Acidimicrobiales bacterium]